MPVNTIASHCLQKKKKNHHHHIFVAISGHSLDFHEENAAFSPVDLHFDWISHRVWKLSIGAASGANEMLQTGGKGRGVGGGCTRQMRNICLLQRFLKPGLELGSPKSPPRPWCNQMNIRQVHVYRNADFNFNFFVNQVII